MTLRILLADDHGIVRNGLRSMIEPHDELEIVAEAENGQTAVSLALEHRPDVIVMDVSMPDVNGIEATRRILKQWPEAKIVGLSMHANKRFISDIFKAGAIGYVLKESVFDELVRAIHAVAEEGSYISPKIADVVIRETLGSDNKQKTISFNEKENRIIELFADGKTTKEIAVMLDVSPKTVDACRRRVMQKLEINSLAELTKYAIREGLTSV